MAWEVDSTKVIFVFPPKIFVFFIDLRIGGRGARERELERQRETSFGCLL